MSTSNPAARPPPARAGDRPPPDEDGLMVPTDRERTIAYTVDSTVGLLGGILLTWLGMTAAYRLMNTGRVSPDDQMLWLGAGVGIGLLVCVVTMPLFEIACHRSNLQGTLGHKLTGMHIVDLEGQPVPTKTRVVRALIKYLVLSLLGIAVLVTLFDPKRRTPWDHITNTRVVKLPPPSGKPTPSPRPQR